MAAVGIARKRGSQPVATASTVETPHASRVRHEGYDELVQSLEQRSGLQLPFDRHKSPSKRRKSPGHDVVKHMTYLFFQDRGGLERALEGFHLHSPSQVEALDDKLNRLLNTLKSACLASQKRSPGSNAKQPAPTPLLEDREHSNIPAAPPSPSLTIKHAPVLGDGLVKYPMLPPHINDEPEADLPLVGKTVTRSSNDLFSSVTPSKPVHNYSRTLSTSLLESSPSIMPPIANLGPSARTTSANTSFTTAGTRSANGSFWSEPAGSQPPASPATTADGAMDLDGANDVDCTQKSEDFGSTIPPLSQWSTHHHSTQTEFPSSSLEYGPPVASSQLAAMEGDCQPDDKGAPLKPGADSAVNLAEQKSDQTSLNWRSKRILDDGLDLVLLPPSCESLPFDLRWEVVRVLQTRQRLPTVIDKRWRHPRTMATLHAFVDELGIRMEKGRETNFKDCSLAAKLKPSTAKDGPLLELELMPPRKERRNEFERAYGGDRVIIVEYGPHTLPELNEDKLRENIATMMGDKHELVGRTWMEFFTREKKRKGKIKPRTVEFHLFATKGPDIPQVTTSEFLNQLLCFRENADQLSGKLNSRLDLKASRTDDGPRFRIEDIELIPDIKATNMPDNDTFNDPDLEFSDQFDSNVDMTDGCGTISAYAMRLICKAVNWDGLLPSAVQGRFFGCKGVWCLRKDATLDNLDAPPPEKLISIRPTQIKIKQDPTIREFTFYVTNFAAAPKPSYLYPGFLPILNDRCVPADDICAAAAFPLEQFLERFMEAVKDPIAFRRWMHEQNDIPKPDYRRLGLGPIGRFPTDVCDKINKMLDSGFHPMKNRYLADEIMKLVEKMLRLKAKEYKIECPKATVLIGVPDHTGTLRPGEIYFRTSRSWEYSNLQALGGSIKEVLVGRNPAKGPGDLQKLRFVLKDELSHLVDVIVFPTQGREPEASKMQGGDYDGDTFWICWDPTLVRKFLNAPAPREADRPRPSELFMHKDERRFCDIVHIPKDDSFDENEVSKWLRINRERKIQSSLLGVVTTTLDAMIYDQGNYTCPAVLALRHLSDELLDAQKKCLSFNWGDFQLFQKRWEINSLPTPAYLEYTRISDNNSETDEKKKRPCDPKPERVLDRVYCIELQSKVNAAKKMIEKVFDNAIMLDEDLTRLYRTKRDRAPVGSVVRKVLLQLKDQLGDVEEVWKNKMPVGDRGKPLFHAFKLEVRRLYEQIEPTDLSSETVLAWMEPIGNSTTTTWDLLKASAFADRFIYSSARTMLYSIAGHEFCLLKASAASVPCVITQSAYSAMKPAKRPRVTVAEEDDLQRKSQRRDSDDDDDVDEEVIEVDEYGVLPGADSSVSGKSKGN